MSSSAARYLRKMSYGARAGGGLESVSIESAAADVLTDERAQEARSLAIETIERESGAKLAPSELEEIDVLFLNAGPEAMARLRNDGSEAELSADHVEALEAIVETDGSRPSLLVSDDDTIDPNDPSLSFWQQLAGEYEEQINQVASSVGRIDLDANHKGTGFVVGPNQILTNRHVLQGIAKEESPQNWVFRGAPSLTFDADPEQSRARQYEIKRVVTTSDKRVGPSLDFNKLDFAVLECEVPDGATFPGPLPLESDRDKIVVERPLYTLGYPAKPAPGAYKFKVLLRLFKNKFSVKRFSPGELDTVLGEVDGDDNATVFTHDTTTLGGNSGSCVVDFGDDGLLVVGLHFAGQRKVENYAHASAELRGALEGLDLTWKDWI